MSRKPTQIDEEFAQFPCTMDEIIRLFGDSRRRQVVAALDACEDDKIALRNLVRRLSKRGRETDPREWRKLLHHAYLPRLEDHGVVEYDSETEMIQYHDCELVSAVLATIERDEIPS